MSEVARRIARYRVRLGFPVRRAGAVAGATRRRAAWRPGAAGRERRRGCCGSGQRGIWSKGREVTASGPYRFTRHPLYLGSTIHRARLCGGVATLDRRRSLVLGYMALTLTVGDVERGGAT